MWIYYQEQTEGEWQLYRCPMSGRKDHDGYEANYRCRWIVQQRHGVVAEVRDGNQVVSRWEWCEAARSACQAFGPDL